MLSMDRGSRRLKSQVRSQGSSDRIARQGNEDGVGHWDLIARPEEKGWNWGKGVLINERIQPVLTFLNPTSRVHDLKGSSNRFQCPGQYQYSPLPSNGIDTQRRDVEETKKGVSKT